MSRSTPVAQCVYRYGFTKPTRAPSAWFRQAVSAAHRGAEALVPPTRSSDPPGPATAKGVSGSARDETSGTPRPLVFVVLWSGILLTFACHVGTGKSTDMPPPVAPLPMFRSFHTTSLVI